MKRGSSGLSLVVGIDKPIGISSHDAVNRCRRLFGEKRVGHAGTLDPLASGVLLVCVGPATRLNPYLTAHDKRYLFTVAFGSATDTDDRAGQVISTGPIPDRLYDPTFASSFVRRLVGRHSQVPPSYSAVKVQGKRSYKAAREGALLELAPRDIEVFEARLASVKRTGLRQAALEWEIEVQVSKGSYIRALARDIGEALDCPAHVGSLRRTQVGGVSLDDCVAWEELGARAERAVLDPVALLGYRMIAVQGAKRDAVANGVALEAEGLRLFACSGHGVGTAASGSCPGILESNEPLVAQEMLSVVAENELVGLYRYDRDAHALRAHCVFPVGVARGNDSAS